MDLPYKNAFCGFSQKAFCKLCVLGAVMIWSFPLFCGNLLWLIYVLNYILKGDFDTVFLPVILFINIFVAEKAAKMLS